MGVVDVADDSEEGGSEDRADGRLRTRVGRPRFHFGRANYTLHNKSNLAIFAAFFSTNSFLYL